MRQVAMKQAQKIGALAASSHWSGKPAIFNGRVAGGALTFLPSLGIDLYNSINRDMAGNVHWDHHRLLVDSAKSQSVNAVGMVVGKAAELLAPRILAIVLAGTTVGAAPAILIGLIAGIAVQAAWNYYGFSDKAGSMAEKALGR